MPCGVGLSALGCPNLLGGRSLRSFFHVEFDLLTFLDGAKSFHFNIGMVAEQILPPIIGSNETVTLRVVKPLYLSFHITPIDQLSAQRAGRTRLLLRTTAVSG